MAEQGIWLWAAFSEQLNFKDNLISFLRPGLIR